MTTPPSSATHGGFGDELSRRHGCFAKVIERLSKGGRLKATTISQHDAKKDKRLAIVDTSIGKVLAHGLDDKAVATLSGCDWTRV